MSFERWGPEGRSRYAALLSAAMNTIAADPDGPTTRDRAELYSDIRSFHLRHARGEHGVAVPVHVIYYRAAGPGLIEIVRVLHDRMDPSRHLIDPTGPGRKPPRRRRRR